MSMGQSPTQQEPVILVREGDNWRQYFVVTDQRVAVVHMEPALLCGWKFGRIDVQNGDSWPNMGRVAIVAWKMANDDGRTRVASDLDSEFRQTLLARAAC